MKGVTLKESRDRKRWTQEELERRSGVSQGLISKLESGEATNPTFETVRKLEAALALRPGSLVFGVQAEAV